MKLKLEKDQFIVRNIIITARWWLLYTVINRDEKSIHIDKHWRDDGADYGTTASFLLVEHNNESPRIRRLVIGATIDGANWRVVNPRNVFDYDSYSKLPE